MPPPDACDPRLRAVGILAPCLFPIPCTTLFLPLPVHGPDLPPLLHIFAAKLQTFAAISMSFGGKLPPFPHDVSAVPARHPRRSRTASSPYPHDAPALIPQTEQPFLPCRRQATTRVSRPCSRIFTCGEMEIATSPFICRGVTISMPEELVNLQALASAESFE